MNSIWKLKSLKISRLALVSALTFAAAAPAVIVTVPAIAQDRGPAQRIVQGKVQSKDGVAAKGAVVYLKDTRGATVKSFIADENGNYRFVQLSQNTDYDLWAAANGQRSKTRTISSFDTKAELNIDLKLE